MAKLSEVHESQHGVQVEDTIYSKEQMSGGIDAPTPVSHERANIIFKLVNNKKNGRVWVDGTDDIINPVTGAMERIRLLTGVSSIWMKDQEKLTPDFVKMNKRNICFEDRKCVVPAWDTTKLEFMRISRHFIDNPNRKTGSKHEFFEWNPERIEQENLKKEMLEIDMAILASQQPVAAMRKHAFFLGVSLVDEMGQVRTDDGIRTAYILKAKRDPVRFQKSLNSVEVDVHYAVKRAVLDAKIDLSHNKAEWAATGGVICLIPQTRNAVEYLIEFALTNSDDGKTFLKQLQEHTK